MSSPMTDEEFRTFFDRYPDGHPVREGVRYALKVESLFGLTVRPDEEYSISFIPPVQTWAQDTLDTYGRDSGKY